MPSPRTVPSASEEKGRASPVLRKDAGFRKTHVHEYVVDGIHATGDHHVAFTGSQFHECPCEWHPGCWHRLHPRRSWCRQDSVGCRSGPLPHCPTARERSSPARVHSCPKVPRLWTIICGSLSPLFSSALRHKGWPRRDPREMTKLLRAGNAENYRGMLTVEFTTISVSGICQGHFGGHQTQQLGGIRGLKGCRRNAEFGGIEGHCRKKSAAIAVNMVRLFGVGIKVVVQLAMGRRRFGNAVYAVEQGSPVLLYISRLGKHATHANDGNRLVNYLRIRCHFMCLETNCYGLSRWAVCARGIAHTAAVHLPENRDAKHNSLKHKIQGIDTRRVTC